MAELYTDKEFAAKRDYNVAKLRFGMALSLWDFLLNQAFLLFGFLPWTWHWAGVALLRAGLPQGELAQSVAWVLLQAGGSRWRLCGGWSGSGWLAAQAMAQLCSAAPAQRPFPCSSVPPAQQQPHLPRSPPRPQSGASLLLSLPWSAWSTFVLEARHGFNKTTARTFIMDRLKGVRRLGWGAS